MIKYRPSWNTDQGVYLLCESLGVKPHGEMKVNVDWIFSPRRKAHNRPILIFWDGFEYEHKRWDPKDGELCLNRVKPEETLVEARSDSDVQIDRQIWV